MPRAAAIVPNRHLHTTLPADLAKRLEEYLWSDAEGKVPRSAIQAFLTARIREFFDTRTIDLAPWLDTPIGGVVVSGSDTSINRLTEYLKVCRKPDSENLL